MAHIIADSTCDLTLAQAEELGATLLSLRVLFGEEVYLDKRTLTNEEFYQKLGESEEFPTTSLLNPEDFLDAFKAHPEEEIVVLTISEQLSGTYQSALLAKETSGRCDVYVVNTQNTSVGMGLLVRRAVEMNRAGIPAERIASGILQLADRVRLIGVVDTLQYLVKGGRLGRVSGYVGGILNIKPVLMLQNGIVQPVLKAHGDRDAFRRIRELVFEKYPIDAGMPVAFACAAGGAERLAGFMEALGLTGPVSTIGSVVGAHAGPGTIIISYFEK